MADAAVTFLLEKVTEVLRYYGHLIGGAENELQQLKNELGFLKAFLVDAAHQSNKGEVFKQMEGQIREVIYEVDDTLDTYLTDVAKTKRKLLGKFARSNIALAKLVKSIRQDRVKPVFDNAKLEFANMRIAEGSGPNGEELRAVLVKKDQTIRRDKIVGFEDEEETLTGYLTEENKELDVISIIGMPGLGKTTLALKIYESQKIQFEFRIRIWVNVSQKFNKKDFFMNILKIFTKEDMSSTSDQELELKVRTCLEKEKFLIVLDDVWSVDDWKDIQNVLPMSNRMGKVMITSREKEVGTHASVRRGPHMLRFLTEEESWKLLQLEVFNDVGICPEELRLTGEEIARNCAGLPLTIVVIGGILVSQFTRQPPIGVIRNEWDKVSENVTHFLRKDIDKRIPEVVALSYERLSDELRECFVYMGVFPEDHEIPAWTLTRLWIAEAFITKKEGQSLEETAEDNLNDLINRNLLMVGRINSLGEVKTCRVHDAIRTFCTSKAVEQNLYQEIKKSKDGVLEPPVLETQKYHRLCFHSDLSKFLSGKPKGPCVRSFLCFYKEPVNLELQYISAIPDAFKLLRVLDSKSIRFQQFPAKVTELIHLRYITLYVDNLKILPEPISRLWNLQTLVVETSSHTLTMKVNIWNMIRLRHLKTKAAIVLDQTWEGPAGENLQTMSRVSPQSCTETFSNKACNMKKLGIRGKLATLCDTKFLEKLHLLEKLKLVNEIYYESEIEDKLTHLPQPNCFPPNLKRLTLTKTSLAWSHMSTLAKINTLEVLKLKDKAFTGITWKAVGEGFYSLQCLIITEANLVSWEASPNYFPRLTCLSLKNCEKLKAIPHELASNLEKLDIDRLRPSAVDSARKIEEQKKQEQGQQKGRSGGAFKLSIGPGRVAYAYQPYKRYLIRSAIYGERACFTCPSTYCRLASFE